MPKTKFQSFIFTAIMVFFMVYSMTVFSIAIKMGELSCWTFFYAIQEMWIEYAIVFCLIFFFISKAAMKLALRIISPSKENPIFLTLAIQSFTVCLIVPIITLIATLLHNGLTANWFTQWIHLAFVCFPTALCLQIFWIGPLVRWIFRRIFAKQLENRDNSFERTSINL